MRAPRKGERAHMTLVAAYVAVALVLSSIAPAQAQPAGFSGTWKLDTSRSRIVPAAGLAGLIPVGAPEMLHVTHAANGTLVVESQMNEGHVRLYTPGGKSTTPVGQGGRITMASQTEGRRVVSEGAREDAAGVSVPLKEVFALSGDGATLTIDITTTGPEGAQASTLVYTRAGTVSPCEAWPTPCKPPPSQGLRRP